MTKQNAKLERSYIPARRDANPVPVGGAAKRALDVCGAAMGLVMLSPLFLMLCLLVRIVDGGPVFHGHRRVGFQGRTFTCWKFRTMTVSGAARPTEAGAVLKRLGLDELPQLFNVLRGEMSLVGPRPVAWSEMEQYGSAAVYYLSARPGLTGAWQIDGSGGLACRERVSTDRHYVENWSFGRDLLIILKTIPAA